MHIYKKIIIVCGMFFLLGLFPIYGNEEIVSENYKQDVFASVDQGILDDIYDVHIHYCNENIEGKKTNIELTINARPGEYKNLCITMINNSPRDQDLTLGFTEGFISEYGSISCKGEFTEKNNNFYKYIDLPYSQIKLSDNGGSFTQTAKIRIPKTTATGEIYGCIAFHLSGAYFKGDSDIFGLKVVKKLPITINITGDVYNYGRRDDLKYAYTDNKQTVLKIIIAIIAIRLIYTIFQTTKKKPQPKKKK